MGQSSAVFDSTLFLACRNLLVCKITDDYGAKQQIWRYLSAARHFCSAKILAGGLRWGTGVLIAEGEVPAQRNFQRKFALRRVGSAKFVVPPTIERSKVRNHARLGKSLYRAAPRCQRDRGPFCFGKSPEEPLPRGSFGQLLRGGSTPRFFSQIRSVGSKPTRLAGYCQSTPGPWTTGPAQKSPPAAALGSKNKKRRAAFAAPKPYSYRGTMIFTAR